MLEKGGPTRIRKRRVDDRGQAGRVPTIFFNGERFIIESRVTFLSLKLHRIENRFALCLLISNPKKKLITIDFEIKQSMIYSIDSKTIVEIPNGKTPTVRFYFRLPSDLF